MSHSPTAPLASLTGCLPGFNELTVASPSSHISLQKQPEQLDGTGAHFLFFFFFSIFVEKKKIIIC